MPQFPIGKVIEHYGGDPVEPDRNWHPVRCPFHEDSDASGSVRTIEEQVFNCFACEMKGNAVQIVMKMEGLGYWDAVRRAEGITGIRNSGVRQSSGRSHGVSGTARDWQGYGEFRRSWLREDPGDS